MRWSDVLKPGWRQKYSQVPFYVEFLPERFQQINCPCREASPINRARMFGIIEAADFEQVNESMSLADNIQRDVRIEHRLQADPGRNAGAVEFADRGDTITGERGSRLPLKAGAIVQQREGRRKCVSRRQEINITERSAPALGQDVDGMTGVVQDLDRLPCGSQFLIERLVRIAGKAQEDWFTRRAGFRLPAQGRKEIGPRNRVAEIIPLPAGGGGRVAIRAGVITPAIHITGEGRVLSRAARRFID